MKRREFVNKTSLVAAGITAIPLISCGDAASTKSAASTTVSNFTLPDLSYGFDALAPSIDARTMEIHHGKHHAGYVRKLNNALQDHRLAGKTLENMMAEIKGDDSDLGVRNNGGGHFNHSLFWSIMTPGGSSMGEAIKKEINSAFGSQDQFEKAFFDAAKTRFGSGWAWLCVGADKKLFITSTPNQDNPLMVNVAEKSGTPILGLDVWEHAYYLNYQNKRGDYIKSFMNVINWDKVAENHAAAIS